MKWDWHPHESKHCEIFWYQYINLILITAPDWIIYFLLSYSGVKQSVISESRKASLKEQATTCSDHEKMPLHGSLKKSSVPEGSAIGRANRTSCLRNKYRDHSRDREGKRSVFAYCIQVTLRPRSAPTTWLWGEFGGEERI